MATTVGLTFKPKKKPPKPDTPPENQTEDSRE